jgi:two-component system OmpR family sensor kinase
MTLRVRLSMFAGLAILVCGLLVGGTSAVVARGQATDALDATINGALTSVREDKMNASAAIDYADSSPVPLSALLIARDSEPISLVEGRDGDLVLTMPTLTLDQVRSAERTFRNVGGVADLRVRSLSVDDGEWVVVGATTDEITSQFRTSLAVSLLLSVVIALVVAALLAWIIGLELKPVSRLTASAGRIASGDLGESLPVATGAAEIAGLTSALAVMVDSLKQALTVTSRSEQRMREFLGDTSHELRTPLSVIRGYVDILNSGQELSVEQRERAMSRLTSESLRMANTINDLLLLAELGEVVTDVGEEVDLSEIINEYITDLRPRQPGRPIETDVPDGIVVIGNNEHLRRLFTNILSNIARHTSPTDPMKVALSADGPSVILTVDDGGPGLSDEMYRRTTEGFQRFDREHSSSGGGFGLGLSIMASIVNNHGGQLMMTPSPLGGLRTTVSLPVRGQVSGGAKA